MGYMFLILTAVGMMGTGVMMFGDSVTLYRARDWPVVEAHLENCQMVLHSSKGDYYWTLTANWSYGPSGKLRYGSAWTPLGAPEYKRNDPRIDSASEATDVTARFCNQASIRKLRVSPQGIVRPDDEAKAQSFARDIFADLFLVLAGSAATAGLLYSFVNKVRIIRAKPTDQ
ncbi:hypothetical protein [Paraburkholderia bannensis]|uniref:hypothetical protein n=1 Tax=Paraburkholderia bannensis TaxID=765414 RepID=UPI002AB7947E|nr:hypothetical protein [Paraburkholderia bannensis]